MKKQFLKRGMASALIMLGAGVHSHDNHSSRHRHNYESTEPDYVTRENDDWFERCTAANTELIRARNAASFHARNGRLAEAASEIRRAIFRVADGDLNAQRNPAPGPHLMIAAREAKIIIETAESAVASLKAPLRLQIEYLISNDMVNLLLDAYKDLDDKYARNVRRECGDCWFEGLPMSYFDGVRDLARRFVGLQIKLQKYQASDLVELKMAKATSEAARNFLEVYTNRRAYCSALNELVDISRTVCDYLDRPSYPAHELIPLIRHRLKHAKEDLMGQDRRDCH